MTVHQSNGAMAALMTSEHGGEGFSPLTTPRRSDVAHASATGASTSIFASMASLLGLQLEDSFFCQICYDDAPVSQSHQLAACGHRFCSSCLQSYVVFHVQEGETDIKCFFQESTRESADTVACLTTIPSEEIKQLVDAATFAKFERFCLNKQHANARQCPYCEYSQLCITGDSSSGDALQCTCESCARTFCFTHGNAHPGETCRSYSKRVRKDEKRNLAVISRLCKPCPGCGQPVEKNGGCNQIKCWACKTSFCWICRAVIDESTFPTHYQWWNVGGCTGSQMTDADDQTKCERVALAVAKGLFLVLFGPPALLLATVCSLIGCCCYPCTKVYNVSYRQAFTSCVCVSGYVLLLPLLVPVAVFFLPCLLIAYCASPQSFRLIRDESDPSQAKSSGVPGRSSPDQRRGTDAEDSAA